MIYTKSSWSRPLSSISCLVRGKNPSDKVTSCYLHGNFIIISNVIICSLLFLFFLRKRIRILHRTDLHAGCLSGEYSGKDILEYETIFGRNTATYVSIQINIKHRLPINNYTSRHHHRKIAFKTVNLDDVIYKLSGIAGGNTQTNIIFMTVIKEL